MFKDFLKENHLTVCAFAMTANVSSFAVKKYMKQPDKLNKSTIFKIENAIERIQKGEAENDLLNFSPYHRSQKLWQEIDEHVKCKDFTHKQIYLTAGLNSCWYYNAHKKRVTLEERTYDLLQYAVVCLLEHDEKTAKLLDDSLNELYDRKYS